MSDHTSLVVWQRAQRIVVDITDSLSPNISRRMPGLRAQLLRAAASISANIGEGASRRTSREYAQFVTIAIASASETENHLTLAIALRAVHGNPETLVSEIRRIRAMLFKLRAYLERISAQSIS